MRHKDHKSEAIAMFTKRLVIGLLLGLGLLGCHKKEQFFYFSTNVPGNPTGKEEVILFLGQSNALGTYQYGSNKLLEVMAFNTLTPLRTENCAVGGSLISSWAPGAPNYQACVQKVRAANMKVYAIVWWQGEAEAHIGATGWGHSFTTLMNAFRTELGVPTLPVVYAQLGTPDYPLPYLQDVKLEQAMVNITNGRMVAMEGIPTSPNDVHFGLTELHEIARRFGVALVDLIANGN